MRHGLQRSIIGGGFLLQGITLGVLLGGWWPLVGLAIGLTLPLLFGVGLPVSGSSLGGLGMLLGSWADVRFGAGLPACHLSGTAGFGAAPWATFMFWGMLLGCLPGCLWPGCSHTRWQLLWGHLGMIVGMILGGVALGDPLGDELGSAFAGSHLGMLLGMASGTALGTRFGVRAAAFVRIRMTAGATTDPECVPARPRGPLSE